MYENSRFLKNRFTFCGVNTNFGQQWAPAAYYHLTPIVSKGKHCKLHQIPKLKCFSSRLVVVFAQSNEARCQVENEDVVGAAPTGDAPATSEWSIILLPTKVRLY